MQTKVENLTQFGIWVGNSWLVSIHHIFAIFTPTTGYCTVDIISRLLHINCSTFASLIYALLIMGTLSSLSYTPPLALTQSYAPACVAQRRRSRCPCSSPVWLRVSSSADGALWALLRRAAMLLLLLRPSGDDSIALSRSIVNSSTCPCPSLFVSVCRIRLARLSVWIFRTCFVWFLLFSFSFHSERYLDDHLMCVHLCSEWGTCEGEV